MIHYWQSRQAYHASVQCERMKSATLTYALADVRKQGSSRRRCEGSTGNGNGVPGTKDEAAAARVLAKSRSKRPATCQGGSARHCTR